MVMNRDFEKRLFVRHDPEKFGYRCVLCHADISLCGYQERKFWHKEYCPWKKLKGLGEEKI